MRDRFPYPYTEADARAWIAVNKADLAQHNLAIVVAGEAVGSIGIIPGNDVFRPSAEIGYWVGAALHGRRIATEAQRALTDHILRQGEFVRLFAGVFEPNVASTRVLEKAGYALEGRLSKSHHSKGAPGSAECEREEEGRPLHGGLAHARFDEAHWIHQRSAATSSSSCS